MNIFMLLKPKLEVAYVYEHYSMRQCLEKMRYHGYSAIPVINNKGEYVATLSEGDFLWNIVENNFSDMESLELTPINYILNEDRNPAIKIDTQLDTLLAKVMEQNFVPVTDDRGIFVGIITRKDIIKYFYKNHRIHLKSVSV